MMVADLEALLVIAAAPVRRALDKAKLHLVNRVFRAHIHWEFWTASNGSYFHNPKLADDSINKGMVISQEAIKILEDAMAKKRTVAAAPAAAPAAPK